MANANNSDYSKVLRERVKELMALSGLELPGFAEYIGVSESHIYSILNGTRELTGEIADKIAAGFNLKGWQLLKLDYKLTKKAVNTKLLNKFYVEHKGVYDYFISTREERKVAYFIEHTLLKTKLFDSPVYVSEVREACEEAGKKYDSKRISQILKYLVDKKMLKSKKRPFKLKGGGYGKRMVDVYYKR